MEFLLEIGLEELPSRYVTKASEDLVSIMSRELNDARISFSNVKGYNSPRRIAVYIENVDSMQKDLFEKKKGPSVQIAFKDGVMTNAAKGFLKGQGLNEEDVLVEDGYIYAQKNLKGEETTKVLPSLIDKVIRSIEFEKNMKWSNRTFRFARPIKWIVATYDNKVVNLEFEGIKASNISRGMRLFGSQEVLIDKASEYENILLKEFVVVDPLKRKQMILDSVKQNCENDGDKVVVNNYLLDEVYNLVEYPYAIKGEFNKNYLDLPEDIITITMETHQRYFPVKDKDGKLTNKFVLVRNAPEYSEFVKKGNEKVIEPRLADAKFFFDEDLKNPLENNVEKLKNVVFQKDMGTIFEKLTRSQKIAKYIIAELNLGHEETILRTIYLAKADLVSNVINEKEFTKLQGFMGSVYAEHDGEDINVAKGIFEHYLPRYQGDILPSTIEGSIASISDKLDTLVGCFSVGIIPTSSKDPYALRRAAQGLILNILNSKLNIDYVALVTKAFEIFKADKKVLNDKALENILDFVKQRLEAVLQTEYSKALISYQINIENRVMDLKNRLDYLAKLEKTENFDVLINLIKRLKNISKDSKLEEVNSSLFETKEEKELYELSEKISDKFADIDVLIESSDLINSFFDNVKINVEDANIKNNRLSLIGNLVSKINKLIQV